MRVKVLRACVDGLRRATLRNVSNGEAYNLPMNRMILRFGRDEGRNERTTHARLGT